MILPFLTPPDSWIVFVHVRTISLLIDTTYRKTKAAIGYSYLVIWKDCLACKEESLRTVQMSDILFCFGNWFCRFKEKTRVSNKLVWPLWRWNHDYTRQKRIYIFMHLLGRPSFLHDYGGLSVSLKITTIILALFDGVNTSDALFEMQGSGHLLFVCASL